MNSLDGCAGWTAVFLQSKKLPSNARIQIQFIGWPEAVQGKPNKDFQVEIVASDSVYSINCIISGQYLYQISLKYGVPPLHLENGLAGVKRAELRFEAETSEVVLHLLEINIIGGEDLLDIIGDPTPITSTDIYWRVLSQMAMNGNKQSLRDPPSEVRTTLNSIPGFSPIEWISFNFESNLNIITNGTPNDKTPSLVMEAAKDAAKVLGTDQPEIVEKSDSNTLLRSQAKVKQKSESRVRNNISAIIEDLDESSERSSSSFSSQYSSTSQPDSLIDNIAPKVEYSHSSSEYESESEIPPSQARLKPKMTLSTDSPSEDDEGENNPINDYTHQSQHKLRMTYMAQLNSEHEGEREVDPHYDGKPATEPKMSIDNDKEDGNTNIPRLASLATQEAFLIPVNSQDNKFVLLSESTEEEADSDYDNNDENSLDITPSQRYIKPKPFNTVMAAAAKPEGRTSSLSSSSSQPPFQTQYIPDFDELINLSDDDHKQVEENENASAAAEEWLPFQETEFLSQERNAVGTEDSQSDRRLSHLKKKRKAKEHLQSSPRKRKKTEET